MRTSNNIKNHARHPVGLILALIGLISAATLVLGPARVALAQVVGPSWTYTGNLNTARYQHTATLLPNGKVLVAGGFDGSPPERRLNSAEIYDPDTGTWSFTGNLNNGRTDHTATLLRNGKVLVTGGIANCASNVCPYLNSAELYDPATGTWSNTGNLNIARAVHTATLLSNGRVLVAGGFGEDYFISNSAELYDPATGTWTITGNLNKERLFHTATLLSNGKVIVAGGSDFDECLNSAELYDPATGTWTITGNLNVGRFEHTATLLPNGKVLIAGGHAFQDCFDELYNPATGTWNFTGSPNGNHVGIATLLRNGQVLVVGNSSSIYDPETDTWSITANLNTTRGYQTATLLSDSKVLIAGGHVCNFPTCSPVNSAELYSPGTSASNQIDDAQFFVRQHYRDFLNREPDRDGFAFWTNEIVSCGGDAQCVEVKRINASAAFFLSIEFQQTGYLVYRFYKASYGNLTDAPVPLMRSEFLPDMQQIGQGVIVNEAGWETVLENNKQAFTSEFVQRSRFTSAFPTSMTPAEFVDALFANAEVTPSASDRTAAINEFGSANTTADVVARARALRRVAENSTLAQQEFNRAFVLMQYFGYLRRNPNDPPELTLDFQGYNFWLNKLNEFNGNFADAEIVKAFIVSSEYRQRFAR